MMYKTHVKVGKVFYIMGINILVGLGLMPNFVKTIKTGNIKEIISSLLIFGILSLVGWFGAIWGSGYNDIDHATSIPRRNNKILGSIMERFGVVHRGKFTHSLDMVVLTFITVLLLGTFILRKLLLTSPLVPADTLYKIILGTYQVWVLSALIGAISHLFADTVTKGGIRILFFLPKVRLIITDKLTYGITLLALIYLRIIDISAIKGIDLRSMVAGVIYILLSYIVSTKLYQARLKSKRNFSKPLVLILAITSTLLIEGVIAKNVLSGTFLTTTEVANLVRVLIITVALIGILPNEDYFITGDDSEWEKIVGGLFNKILPLAGMVTLYLMFTI